MLLNTFARIKTRQNCEQQKSVSKCPCLTFSEAMTCLDAKISLVLTIVPHSTFYLIGPCNTHSYRQSHKATKIHTLTSPTYDLFFLKQLNKLNIGTLNVYELFWMLQCNFTASVYPYQEWWIYLFRPKCRLGFCAKLSIAVHKRKRETLSCVDPHAIY